MTAELHGNGVMATDPEPGARAARKAQTRAQISQVARRLFADHGFDTVTIADVATAASVSVQTVYNHFATKEDLFFDGRTRWVDGPADAVRSIEPGTPPLTALRDHLIEAVWDAVHLNATPEGQVHTAAVDAYPALRVHEMTLLAQAERRLTQALDDSFLWTSEPDPADCCGSPRQTPKAALVSATWLAAARVVVAAYRSAEYRSAGDDPTTTASEAAALIDQILCRLETI